MTIRRRTYPEILENVLTTLLGGVSAEAHPFPPPGADGGPFRHILQQEGVAEVVSVYGSRNGRTQLFRQGRGQDYQLVNEKTIQWEEGAQLPDPDTLIHINYRLSAPPNLTDIHVGSVMRTLAESAALEIARLYAQLEAVYKSAFIDTASGRALEHVVALLDIQRVQGGRATGQLQFTRTPGTRGVITIPAGTRAINETGDVEYETTQSASLADGQNVVRVTARDLELNEPQPADTLTVLPIPIAGIAGITNPAPMSIASQDETDAELRTRAKNFLAGSQRATLGAIVQAIAREGLTADILEREDQPGLIEVTLHAERITPEQDQRLRKAIEDTKPAGVRVEVLGVLAPRGVSLQIRLTTAEGLLQEDVRAAHHSVQEKIKDYFSRLPVRESASVNQIVGLALSVPEVRDIRLIKAKLDDGTELSVDGGVIDISGFPTKLESLQIADPSLPSLLGAAVTFPADAAPADKPKIEAALIDAVNFLTDQNAKDDATDEQRNVTFDKLLHAIPLPLETKVVTPLSELTPDTAPTGDISPYKVTFTITQETAVSQMLTAPGDEYELTPHERVSLASVTVQAEEDDA